MTSIDLSKITKGQRINLTKETPEMLKFKAAMGWNPSTQPGVDFDLDVSAFLCGADGKVVPNENFVYYGNLSSSCGSVVHSGDNLTGEGEGDDEVITIDFSKVPSNVEKITLVVTIHDAEKRKQNFGQVNDAFVRLVDVNNDVEKLKFDLTEDYSTAISLRVCELYRKDNTWRFNALEEPSSDDLGAICRSFGLDA